MQSTSHDGFYDFQVCPTKLTDLVKGWEVKIHEDFNLEESKARSAIFIPIVGLKSAGKSWFLSKLHGMKDIPHGIDKPTKGICVKYSSDNPDVCPAVFFDTEPRSKFIPTQDLNPDQKSYQADLENRKLDYLCTEKIVEAFLCQISTLLIFVLNELTYENQVLLNSLRNLVRGKTNFTFVVIHNFQNIEQKSLVEYKIKNEILSSLNLQESQCGYVSNDSSQLIHLFLAKENSEAGDYYNQETIDFVQKKINVASPAKLDLMGVFLSSLKANLREYYDHPDLENLTLEENKIILKSDKQGEIIRPPYTPLDRIEDPQTLTRATVNSETMTLTLEILCPGEIEVNRVKMRQEIYPDQYRIHFRIPRKKREEKENEKELFNTFTTENELLEVVSHFISARKYHIVDFKDRQYRTENGYLYISWKYTEESMEIWE